MPDLLDAINRAYRAMSRRRERAIREAEARRAEKLKELTTAIHRGDRRKQHEHVVAMRALTTEALRLEVGA